MMSELGYFTRLIEMTTRSSEKGFKTSKDEPEKKMYNNNDEPQISTRPDGTDFQAEFFTDMSNNDVDHHDANPRESEISRVVIQDNFLDSAHKNEKKHAKSLTSTNSNTKRTPLDKNDELEKKYDDKLNTIDSKSAPFFTDISEKRLD